MKNNLIVILTLLILGIPVMAEELQPAQETEDNRASVIIQKQPATVGTHKQSIKQNKWCIIIQVNGKVKENGTADNTLLQK